MAGSQLPPCDPTPLDSPPHPNFSYHPGSPCPPSKSHSPMLLPSSESHPGRPVEWPPGQACPFSAVHSDPPRPTQAPVRTYKVVGCSDGYARSGSLTNPASGVPLLERPPPPSQVASGACKAGPRVTPQLCSGGPTAQHRREPRRHPQPHSGCPNGDGIGPFVSAPTQD